MEAIRLNNNYCADCSNEGTEYVNMQFGVFLCINCGEAHQSLNMPIRKLDDSLTQEEINFLSSAGNQKANISLMINFPPWVASPKKYHFEYNLF